jgi:Zc3h12a-like Ribonuclease NYN domain
VTVAPGRHVVVVDGSNLATEGRTTPSLRQLDEAVRAYAAEDPAADIVVVVDASFEHRIDPSERQQLIDAELHGEVVSPPAGAIGRGDAFVLRIAERTGARVLSNDSFQEFHAEHPWLFDDGRLMGGKPVPGVGWIFTPRIPVRGPKSRQATGKAKRKEAQELSPPVKAAELAKAAKKVAARRAPAPALPDGSKPKVGDVWPPPTPVAGGSSATGAKKKSKKSEVPPSEKKDGKAKSDKERTGGRTAKKTSPETTAKKAAAKKAVAKKAAPKAAPKPTAKQKESGVKAPVTKRGSAAPKASGAAKASATKKAAPQKAAPQKAAKQKAAGARGDAGAEPMKKAATKKAAAKKRHSTGTTATASGPGEDAAGKPASKRGAGEPAPAQSRSGTTRGGAVAVTPARPVAADGTATSARSTAAKIPVVREAIGQALAEVIAPASGTATDGRRGDGDHKRGKQDGKAVRSRRRRSTSPTPAVNEPFAFITFVATYPLDSELEGEVVSFTSHGAMVDVDLPEGGVLHSYIPLGAMGDPPPTKARQVLTRGERRVFVLVALDPPRRVAELALPEFLAGHRAARR